MSATEADKLILEEIAFVGEISINGETAPITFRVSAGAECRLLFDVDPVGVAPYLLAVRNQGADGTRIQKFTLTGKSADGKTISSEHMFVGPHGSNDDAYWIRISSTASRITLTLDHSVDKPFLRKGLKGAGSTSTARSTKTARRSTSTSPTGATPRPPSASFLPP